MKNKLTVLLALSFVLFVAIGCNLGGIMGSDEEVSKDSTSKSTDSASDDSSSEPKKEAEPSGEVLKVGIEECDELATYINDNAEQIGEQNIVVRGIVEMYKQTIFSSLRDSVKDMDEEQKAKTGENCKKALDNVKKQMQK